MTGQISKEAIEAAHAEINKSWRNERWEWDAPKSAAERALRAALPFLPIAGEGKVSRHDWFAGNAIAGFCANPAVFAANEYNGWALVNCTEEQLAVACHRLADAMIEARKEGEQ